MTWITNRVGSNLILQKSPKTGSQMKAASATKLSSFPHCKAKMVVGG